MAQELIWTEKELQLLKKDEDSGTRDSQNLERIVMMLVKKNKIMEKQNKKMQKQLQKLSAKREVQDSDSSSDISSGEDFSEHGDENEDSEDKDVYVHEDEDKEDKSSEIEESKEEDSSSDNIPDSTLLSSVLKRKHVGPSKDDQPSNQNALVKLVNRNLVMVDDLDNSASTTAPSGKLIDISNCVGVDMLDDNDQHAIRWFVSRPLTK